MATLTQSFLQGEIVEEKYTLIRFLGGSEHSAVFQTQYGGVHPKDAAIKLLPAPPGNSEARLSGWRLAANISHPHLMRIIDMGRCEIASAPMLFVVTELASENLSEILPERPLTPMEAQEMLASLLDALAFLHNRGFVHGHIKPSNIMAVGNELKLSADTICRLGEPVESNGVPSAYAAPEGSRGGASRKADIWSLGVTLVEVLTQQKLDWSSSSRRDPVVPEAMPPGFAEIARHCLRRSPDKRWPAATIRSHVPRVMSKPVSSRAMAGAMTGIAHAAPIMRAAAERSAREISRVARAAAHEAPKVRNGLRVLIPATRKLTEVLSAIWRNAQQARIPKPGVPHARKYVTGAAVLAVALVAIAAGVKFAGHSGSSAAATRHGASPTIAVKHMRASRRESRAALEEHRRREFARSEKARVRERFAAEPVTASPVREIAESRAGSAPANTAPVAGAAESSSPAPSSGTAGIANGLVAGHVLQRVMPDVPRSASNTIWGTVRVAVRVAVDASGNVTGAELQSAGPSRYFARLSLEAARKWHFAAPTQNGSPVASVWLLHFGYRHDGMGVEPSQVQP